MKFDSRKLRGKITEVVGSQAKLAESIGMSEHTLSVKLNGETGWKSKDILTICDILGIRYDEIPLYFFTPEVQRD